MDVDKILREKFTMSCMNDGHILVNGFTFPGKYKELKQYYENLEVDDEDVWICNFPKSGTTWVQEMVWMILNNCDVKKSELPIYHRSPFLEANVMYFDFISPSTADPTEHIRVRKQKGPLVIKTHLPFELLPTEINTRAKKPKVIYITRDPKDICVSYYHHFKLFDLFKGEFNEFCECFLAGKVPYGPYWKHIFSYWKMRNDSNFLFLKYEEMKNDLSEVISQVSGFLERPLTDDQMNMLTQHLSFKSMKKNPAVNYEEFYESGTGQNFIRKGIVGDHKNIMLSDMIKRFEDWTKINTNNTDYLI
ncbi:hypothetical protein MTP99_002687 [Tenebrio molitor]|nr:hypothetical protein MTP99_002687 [Tenebrio molitor]